MGNPVARNHAIPALVVGITEVVIAMIIIICSFVLSGKADMSISLTPYWAGIPFIIPGILGAVIGCTKNYGVMVAFMVLNIIVFIVEAISCILIAIVVAVYASYAEVGCTRVYDGCVCRSSTYGSSIRISGLSNCDVIKDISTMLYLLLVFLVIAAAVTLAGSIVGCMAVCCGNRQNSTPGVIIQQPMVLQQQAPPPSYYPPQKQ